MLIALTYDDGPSWHRPRLLQLLRDKQVHAAFFDNGVRADANPQVCEFQVREGHLQLNHTYSHPHMSQLSLEACRDEVLRNEAVFAASGAPMSFQGIAVPFGDSTPELEEMLVEMEYLHFSRRINADDWLPERTATEIGVDVIGQLKPCARTTAGDDTCAPRIVGLHDGPIDTPAGAATVEATGRIIDAARALGYEFGVLDSSGQVVADTAGWADDPVPAIANPVPYRLPLAFGVPDQLPPPWVAMP